MFLGGIFLYEGIRSMRNGNWLPTIVSGLSRTELARAIRRYRMKLVACDHLTWMRDLRMFHLRRFAVCYGELKTRQDLKRLERKLQAERDALDEWYYDDTLDMTIDDGG